MKSVEKAIHYLREQINSDFFPAAQLPSISRLASMAGVSYVTMWKAVNELKEEGILEGATGHRSIITSQRQLTVIKKTGWERIRDSIQKDVLNGVYQQSAPLPSAKQLQARYGTSFPTLKKALDSLVHRRIVRHFKRGYVVAGFGSPQTNSRIVIVGTNADSQGHLDIGFMGLDFVRLLESACIRSRVGMNVIMYSERGGRPQFADFNSGKSCRLDKSADVLGYILMVISRKIGYDTIVNMLYQTGKPVSIMSQIGQWRMPAPPKRTSRACLFPIAVTPEPAIAVARYLLHLGHKTIAYFSPFHKALWSKKRQQFLSKTFSDAGFAKAVHAYTLNKSVTNIDYKSDAYIKTKFDKLAGQYSAWKQAVSSDYRFWIDRVFDETAPLACAEGEIYHQLVPLFNKALGNKAITAWVAANDFTARLALHFMECMGVRAGSDISVISFDDTNEALQLRLTSFNFNIPAAASAMVGHILGSDVVGRQRKGNTAEIEGYIVPRSSTGRA